MAMGRGGVRKTVAILKAELTELDSDEIHILRNMFRKTSREVVAACVPNRLSSKSYVRPAQFHTHQSPEGRHS